MMKFPFLAVASLALVGAVAQAQDSKPLNIARVPIRADAPVLFAPAGWKIEKRVDGDLNRDKVFDAVLVLVQNTTAKNAAGDPTPRQRALVVLLHDGKGWRRVGFNGELLMGTRDGGAFYGVVETPVNLAVARVGIIIKMEGGSREVTSTTHRLRYDPKQAGVYLIGVDSVTRDRATGDVTSKSSNFLTGVKKTAIFKGSSNKGVTKTSRVSTKLRALESLREADRYDE
ncbi:hypothetical protein IAD21_00381 [Abditibacteriota bacterium]|nr:hypothetical protein IAD21_00381 [Abditibacteriota bacterium]